MKGKRRKPKVPCPDGSFRVDCALLSRPPDGLRGTNHHEQNITASNQENTLKPIRRILIIFLATAAIIAILPCRAQALTADEVKGIGEQEYIYGYSLLTMEMTR